MSDESSSTPPSTDKRSRGAALRHMLTTREGWVGDYDYKAQCIPRLPCLRSDASRSIFFGLDDHLPILVAILLGFQHALVMVGSIIAVPRVLGGDGNLQLEPKVQAYLISTALTISGMATIVQVVRIKLIYGYWIGSGLIAVSGISFAFLPIAESSFRALREDGTCPQSGPCPDAYGMWLGTVMVGSLLEIALSFIPQKVLRRAFPSIVTGVTVFLIGASLLPVGLIYWAGGAGPCKDVADIRTLGAEVPARLAFFADCPNISGPGIRHYPWGSAEWIGLGFFVFLLIILLEIFGSPFQRNTGVMVAVVAGIILSSSLGYLDRSLVDATPVFTFPLVHRFKLGFYPPAIIPVLIAFVVSTVETLGDIAASCEASRVESEGEVFESRVQGGLLADGLNSLLAGLLTSSPTTTYSHNNAMIMITQTANRTAGVWCGIWLIVMGTVGKVGGIIMAVPDAVLGGMMTFLFANTAISGVKMFSKSGFGRRERFILAGSLSVGLGVVIVPNAFTFFLPETDNAFWSALRQSAVIILTTGFSLGALVAAFLNLVMPEDREEFSPEEYKASLRNQ